MLRFNGIFIIILLLGLLSCFDCLAAPLDSAQTKKTLDLIKNNQRLVNNPEKEMKIFIKGIIVKGAVSVTSDQLSTITKSYENSWLTAKDLSELKRSIRQLYRKNKLGSRLKKVRSKIKSGLLEIQITENI